MLIMMKIVFAEFPETKASLKWFSLYSPSILWPLYGVSIYEVLSVLNMDVQLFLNDSSRTSIWSRRFKIKITDKVSDEALVVNSRIYGDLKTFLDLLDELSNLDYKDDTLFTIGGSPAFIYTPSGLSGSDFSKLLNNIMKRRLNIGDLYVYEHPWDLLRYFLTLDLNKNLELVKDLFGFEEIRRGVYALGDVEIDDRYTYVDTSDGPILIFEEVNFEGFNVLKGPLILGSNTLLSNSKVYHSIIGPVCKIGSEVGDSLILGYSNSAHHGYIGHSLVGYWVNIGAGTIFSDLKNTYGGMRVKFMGKTFDLGTIKFGSVVGDYVKISINTSIYGGKIIGLSSHVSGLISGNVEPFTIYDGWRDISEDMHIEKAVEIAERMYRRRGVKLLDGEEELFRKVFQELREFPT